MGSFGLGAILAIGGLVLGAALLWIALAAKMVADDEAAKAQAEAERRRIARLKRASAAAGQLPSEGTADGGPRARATP
jgi:hypothetical protein